MPISLEEQIATVNREIALRMRVYPKWVREQRMTFNQMQHEIQAMRAVLDTLKSLLPEKQGGLFEASDKQVMEAIDR